MADLLSYRTQIRDRSREGAVGYILFVLWPIFAFIHAIFNLDQRASRFVIIAFYTLCGFFYPFSFSDNVDVVRHAERFMLVAELPFSEFFKQLATLYVSENYKPDIAQSLIEFVLSRFTSDYRIYLGILGLIFAYALTEITSILHKDYKVSRNLVAFVLVMLVFTLYPPYRLAGFRQCLAAFVFAISAYHVLIYGHKKYIFGLLATVLIHFGFFAMLPFFFVCLLAGTRYWFYFFLIGAMFLLQDQAPALIGDIGNELQGQLSSRVTGYASDRYIELINELKQRRNIFIDNQVRWTAYFFFGILLIQIRKLRIMDMETQNLFCLSLSLFAFLVFASNLETTFVRFSLLYIVVSCMIQIRMFSRTGISFLIKAALVLVFAFNFLIMTRKAIEYTGIQVLFPNVFMSFFLETNDSIYDLIK